MGMFLHFKTRKNFF